MSTLQQSEHFSQIHTRFHFQSQSIYLQTVPIYYIHVKSVLRAEEHKNRVHLKRSIWVIHSVMLHTKHYVMMWYFTITSKHRKTHFIIHNKSL